MRFLVIVVFSLPLWAQYKVTPPTVIAETNKFIFHMNFWQNLHHTLIQNGKLMGTEREPKLEVLPEKAQEIWRNAALFYKSNVPDEVLDQQAVVYKNAIIEWTDPAVTGPGLPPDLTRILAEAAPVYRSFLWKQHRKANEDLLQRLLPLVRNAEEWMAPRLARALGETWPEALVPVDLVATGYWAPGYSTTEPGHVILLTAHPRIRDNDHALEILFHESSHLLARRLTEDLNQVCGKLGVQEQPGLLHALLFYTTGKLTSIYLKQEAGSQKPFIPYADEFGLYKKSWAGVYPLIKKYWETYLSGHAEYQQALVAIVQNLP